MRIHNKEGKRTVYTVIRDRAHSSVAFLLGEDLRYQPENDKLTIYPGIIGSYPNFMFDITAWQQEHQPLQAGIFDINRYKNL